MLVGKLHIAIALEQHAEEVIGRDLSLQHHAVDEEHRHLRFGLADAAEEDVLQQALLRVRALAGKLVRIDRLTGHDRADGVLVDQLRLAIAPEQDREIIEPGYDALQLHALHQEYGDGCLLPAKKVQKSVLQIWRLALRGWLF